LGSGQFDWTATILTADTLAFFSLSLFAQCLIPLLARAFFALRDTWTPFVVAFISALINIIFGLVLKNNFGVAGLAFAFSISMAIQLALLWMMLRLKTGSLNELPILHSLYKISLAGLLMALVVQWIKTPLSHLVNMDRFWGIFTQGAIAGLLGLAIYVSLCLLLKVEEVYELKDSLKKRWLKVDNLPSEISEEM
jgi:putative peptidoglycan lipid II flippase